MKNFYILMVALLATFFASAKEIVVHQGDANFEITTDTWSELGFNLEIPLFDLINVKTSAGIFTEIVLDGANSSLVIGAPKVPVLNRLIEIPQGAELNISILSSSYTDYVLDNEGFSGKLIPYQGSQVKTWNGQRPFQFDQLAYALQGFLQQELVSTEYVGEMRGVDIGRLSVSPFWYDPSTNTLRVWHHVSAVVSFVGGDMEATLLKKQTYYSPFFETTQRMLWNYKPLAQTVSGAENIITSGDPVRMVIVADTMFRSTLQPFIAWKKKKGFIITEAYMQNPQVGTSSASIKSYLQGLYNNAASGNPAPSFILFVGDVAQLPPFNGSGHVTDRNFCEYTNDALPEVYYGRFSAETVSQLQIQVEKTLEYEMYLMQDPAFLDEVVLIAGADGTFGPLHGNGQINYGTSTYFNTAHGFVTDAYLYPGSSSNASLIRQKIGAGVGFANYTAHGSSSGWADPSFTTSHVPQMTNGGRYPLMVGNACLTNKFNASSPCFGEALLRASDKGAIAYIGASNNTYWDEDFYWAVGVGTVSANPSYAGTTAGLYDLFVHDHGEPFSQWAMTSAQIMFAGNMAVTQAASSVNYYWEIYHVMGDPSLMPYLGMPSTLQVNYVPLLPVGLNTFTVNTSPFAYVALSYNDSLYGAGLADSNGVATLNIHPFSQPCQADVVVTAQNKQPWMGTLTVATPNGPYLIYSQHSVDDAAGNANGKADFGESISLDIDIMNLTSFSATTVECRLRTNDPYITLTDSTYTASVVAGNDTLSVAGMFSFLVNTVLPDGHSVPFTLFLQDQALASWTSHFSITLNAPKLKFISLEVDDKTSGNGNGRLDAGESADFVIKAVNMGHADAGATGLNCLSSMWEVPVPAGVMNYTTFLAGDTITAVFPTTVAPQTPNGLVVELDMAVVYASYGDQWQAKLMVGLVDEDFETGDFTRYAWTQGGTLAWTPDQTDVYEGSYSAKSGSIGDQQESTLSISMNVISDDSISFFRKVSSESYYDFLEFYIDATMIEQWSGTENWDRMAYPVAAGQHTFTWKYIKDYYLSDGQDCGWIDYIVFPPTDIFAGTEENPIQSVQARVWPNPASEIVNIEIGLQGLETKFMLFDAQGRLVRSLTNPAGIHGLSTVQFGTAGLRQGMYFLVIENESRKETMPIVVTP